MKTTLHDTTLNEAKNPSHTKPFFQPKLTINEPGDQYEQEADAMADNVMRMPMNEQPFFLPKPLGISHVQRKCAHCEEEENQMQRKENSSQSAEASSETSSYINSLSSKGSPLPDSTRSFFEPRFGYDFSDVKIHNDSVAAKSANSINALAYTTGNNIVFNQNQFFPESDNGKKLIAHELTHVVQQKEINYIQRKGEKKETADKIPFDRETFFRENCFNVKMADPLKAKCEFSSYEEKVVRIAKEYAIRKCGNAILALDILHPGELNYLSKLIFHEEKAPPRKQIQTTISMVRDKLEHIPTICKTCYDEECHKGGRIAYVRPDHLLIEICPLFFSKEKLTETPRYLIHEACHLAGVDIDNYFSKNNSEAYCTSGDLKSDYWNNPCPADVENLTNADAWSFFIDRLSITV